MLFPIDPSNHKQDAHFQFTNTEWKTFGAFVRILCSVFSALNSTIKPGTHTVRLLNVNQNERAC